MERLELSLIKLGIYGGLRYVFDNLCHTDNNCINWINKNTFLTYDDWDNSKKQQTMLNEAWKQVQVSIRFE